MVINPEKVLHGHVTNPEAPDIDPDFLEGVDGMPEGIGSRISRRSDARSSITPPFRIVAGRAERAG